jgi:hypothetical protein
MYTMYLKMAEKRTADSTLRQQLRGVFDPADYGVSYVNFFRVSCAQTATSHVVVKKGGFWHNLYSNTTGASWNHCEYWYNTF